MNRSTRILNHFGQCVGHLLTPIFKRIAVAKRAREIAEKAEIEGIVLTDKPVDMAVQDFVQDKYYIIEPDPVQDDVEEEE